MTEFNIYSCTGMLLKNDIKYKIVHLKEDCKDVDLIAVFGGDGTILSVVDYAMTYNIPILAINTGKVGFLSSLESDEIEKAIELIKNDCDFEKRSVMKVTVNGVKYYALNEIVVERRIEGSSKSEVASLNLELNGNFVDKYIAGFEKELNGAKISDKKVVRDGNVITAAGMGVALEFGLELVKILKGEKTADALRSAVLAD